MSERALVHTALPHIHVFADQHETATAVAASIRELVTRVPWARISYATGNTMIPVYEAVKKLVDDNSVSLTETTAFHLDEYYPCSPEEVYSFVKFLRSKVFEPFKLKSDHIFELRGDGTNPEESASAYEAAVIKEGVDLAILGIGPGCHIGFNERGTPFTARTHLAQLSQETIRRDHEERRLPTPGQALTQGIGTILDAREVILVAYGREKGQYLKEMLDGIVSEDCPASALRTVPDKVHLFIDEAAARIIEG